MVLRQFIRLALISWLLAASADVGWAQAYQRNVGQNWDFTTAPDSLGWTLLSPLSSFGLKNGALGLTTTAASFTILSPSITVAGASNQRIEIVMSSDTSGAAKAFWAPTPQDVNMGFSGDDTIPFTVIGDGNFHQYLLAANTAASNSIYRIKIDLPAGANISIQSITVTTLVAPSGSGASPSWQFSSDDQGWTPYSGVFDMSVSGGYLQIHAYSNTTIFAPNSTANHELSWFSAVVRVIQTNLQNPWIIFNFASTANNGGITQVQTYLTADSIDHMYNVNVAGASGWWSSVSNLAIEIPENTTVAIRSIGVSSTPQGGADLLLDSFGATDFVRAGVPFHVACRLSARGTSPVQGLSANLVTPSDGSIRILTSPGVPISIQNGYPQTLQWTLIASQPESAAISVSVSAQQGGAAQATATVLVNPAVTPSQSPYVPAPEPVTSNYDVGIYYFPGWNLSSHWDLLRPYPERRPAIGYYAEGDPRVTDWQIKYAVEHGVNFFAVDWYWSGANTHSPGEEPNPFLQGYLSSTYRKYIKFCLTIGSPDSPPDFTNMMQTLINEYLSMPEYYTINGMPVVISLAPAQLDSTLGGSSKEALNAARQFAQTAGLKGIYFIAATDPAQISQFEADGYDALSAYNYPGAGTSDPDETPYGSMVTAYASTWDLFLAGNDATPYIIPTSPGWDPRPWSNTSGPAVLVRTGSSVDQFTSMLQMAKSRIDAGKAPKIVLVEAWNELGEGSYLEPSVGRGFSYLDALRSVFATDSPHADVTPADVGLPLIEAQPATSLWTFTKSADLVPWQITNLGPPFFSWAVNLTDSQVVNNQWTFTSTTGANLIRMGFQIPASSYSGVAIRMSASTDTVVTVGFGTDDATGDAAPQAPSFTVKAGPIQTYTVNLSGNALWHGIINLLRLSMYNAINVNVAIQSIEFIPTPSPTLSSSATQLQFTSTVGQAASIAETLSLGTGNGSGIAWTATTNASWFKVPATSGTAPGNVIVTVDPVGLAIGVYNGVLTIASPGAASGQLAIPVSLWITPSVASPPSPSIIAIVDGADFKSEPFSPGAWISIFGQDLGQADQWASASSMTVGGANVSVCGLPAAISYNSGPVITSGKAGWQINALIPDGITEQTSCPVVVSVAGRASSPASVTIAKGVMELFQFSSAAGTLPLATHADYSLVGPASAGFVPANTKETVILWGTGDCAIPGAIAGGSPAVVAFSGRVGPGLCQINLVVPDGLAGSNQLNLSTSPTSFTLWISP